MLSEKPWRLEAVLRLWLWVFICLLLGALIGWGLKKQTNSDFATFIVGTIFLHWAALVFVHLFLREHGCGWREGFGFNVRLPWPAVLLTILIACICVPAGASLLQFWAYLLMSLGLKPEQQALVTTIQTTTAIGPQIYMSLMAVSVVPITEEILFRGIVYPFFRQKFGWARSCWLVAALFGAIHMNLMTFLPLSFLGLVLAWVYERTGNLFAPILIHSLFNLANLLEVALGQGMGGT